ncbi:uncharacterized protein CXQ87_001149 [Candidozyma duobushaemuli]|uniref:UBC core domain-containing protein n=2 Tax=Candidozyma TaxID=3303203 RepID=A0ABX8I2P7_9ASCO|nr:uncharacterized protein CXQ87_001149 [[Candida] duobushaemulonis]PVH18231.1 hypothetical protein CXQ87_001149 [[Candida] duobushaemulonis]QWU86785.1 hypothetical protein CA3LBN_001003 [[Candida] haemuloni]
MSQKRLLKELKQLNKQHPSLTNAQIMSLEPVSEDSLYHWRAVIAKPTKADSAYYYNGQWTLEISVGDAYPKTPPSVIFAKKTPICHPNINIDTGEICLDILKDESWSPAWNLEHIVVAILMLLDDPEPDSPLNIDSANLFKSDKAAFESVVQYNLWRHGTFFEGTKEPSGVKSYAIIAYDMSSEEEDEPDSEQETERDLDRRGNRGGHGSGLLDESFQNLSISGGSSGNGVTEGEIEKLQSEAAYIARKHEEQKEENVKQIHQVGEKVTQEFIEKANEVGASSPICPSETFQSMYMQSVHQQVAENVSKQVEEICLKNASSPQPKILTTLTKYPQEDVEQVKERFLRQVDQQVDEIRRIHERRQAVA